MAHKNELNALRQELDDLHHRLVEVEPERLDKRGMLLWDVGEVLFRLDRFAEAAEVFDDAAELLSGFAPPGQDMAIMARIRQAFSFAMIQQDADGLGVLEALFARHGFAVQGLPFLNDAMPGAIGLWLTLLDRSDDREKADRAAKLVIQMCGPGVSDRERHLVASAISMRGRIAVVAGRPQEGVDLFQEVLDRYCSPADPALEEVCSEAVSNRARAYELAGQTEKARLGYEESLQAYANLTEPWALRAAAYARERLKLMPADLTGPTERDR